MSSGSSQSSEQTSILGELPKAPPKTPPVLQLPTKFTSQQQEVGLSYSVTVPYVESPSVVWGQLSSFERKFQEMTLKMASRFRDSSSIPGLKTPVPGQPQFADDSQWYRCRVDEVDTPSNRARVILVDFGNTQIVKVFRIEATAFGIYPPAWPVQAISFSMHGVEPAGACGLLRRCHPS